MAILVVDRCYITMNLLFVLTFLLFNLTYCFSPKNLNVSAVDTSDAGWSTAKATWYGNPTGFGSDGGACGYQNAVAQPPFSSMISAGGSSLFKSGIGCGACYQVKCTSNSACSGNPIMVVITDACHGCGTETFPHFDLSGTAFGALANSGQESYLRDSVGTMEILYTKVACNYIDKPVTFHVDNGANPYHFIALAMYVDGEIGSVELKQAGSDMWLPMTHSWGANWKLESSSPLQSPLSLKVTSLSSGQAIVASDVIPAGWQAGMKYESNVKFQV